MGSSQTYIYIYDGIHHCAHLGYFHELGFSEALQDELLELGTALTVEVDHRQDRSHVPNSLQVTHLQ